jgi:hypothetical protein
MAVNDEELAASLPESESRLALGTLLDVRG